MSLVELQIEQLSQLRCCYRTPDDSESGLVEVLVISFSGSYGYGSRGNADATFIVAKTMAGLAAYEPCCLILDFQEMSYEFGNSILRVWQEVAEYRDYDDTAFPVLVVTSDLCHAGISSLFEAFKLKKSPSLFQDIERAIAAGERAARAFLDS